MISRINPRLEEDLFAACSRYDVESYTRTAVIASVLLTATILTVLVAPLPALLPHLPLHAAVAAAPLAFIGFLVLTAYLPKVMVGFRRADLDAELPFFLIYAATLATVLPPLQVFERLSNAPSYVFREAKREGRRILVETRIVGRDPVAAAELVARTNPHRYWRTVLEGYATAVKSGSNPTDYLIKQAEVYLRKAAGELKARAEAISSLMDALVSVFAFATITLFSLSISGEALPTLAGRMLILNVPKELTAVAYTMPLLLAGMFLLLARSLQPRSLVGEYRQYVVIGPLIVVAVALSAVVTLAPLPSQLSSSLALLGRDYMVKPLLISLVLLASSIVASFVDTRWSRFYSSIREGLRQFVKDLAELRRTGVAPEQCISTLTSRDYGIFSKYVGLLDAEIKTSGSLEGFMKRLRREVRDWTTLCLMFTLIESLEVGGGKPEVFDRFANYTDSLFVIESEKRSRMKILRTLPFATAVIQFFAITSVLFIYDFITTSLGRGSVASSIGPIVFSVLVITNFIYGIIAGLLSEERLSAGFKYSALLTVISIVMLVMGNEVVRGLISLIGVSGVD